MTYYDQENQFLRQRLQKEIPILTALIQNLYQELDRKFHLNGAKIPVTFGFETDSLGSYTRQSAHEKEHFHFSRKILRRNPDQDQNHKRSDRHCFHCCNQRRQEFFCNGKPTGKCSSCNSRRRTKKESGSDACSGKQQGLPEERFCYKRKKAFQNSGRRCQKDLLPDKNTCRLPDHKPEHDRPALRFSLFLFFVFIRNNRSHLLEVLLRLPPGSGL